MSAIDIPKPPGSSVASDSVHESRSRHSRRGGPPSVIDTSVHVDTPPVPATTEEDHPPPSVNVDTSDDPVITVPTFRGQPVDTRPTGGHGPPMAADRFQSPPDAVPPRPLFNSAATNRTGTLTRTPTRMHPFSAEVTFGAESFEDYMCQFMCGEDSFMSGLIYTALTQESTFPNGSREQSAVEGCPPQAGYHVVYSLFRLHHPLLHSVFSTASEIPRQRRTEPFSLYIRRLQDFMVRERQATRTYTESEALDLSVRNLTSEWRPEIRRLVERDKRTGHDGALPFKLSLAQLATTFVEYASEIGRDPPSSQQSSTGRTPTSIIRRIETASPDFSSSMSEATLDDEEINLMVRAISQNQDASSVCLGCHLPGHKLEDCNRFVDYIVAEGLAQRNPQLKAQIANSHKQFRSRLNSANTRGRPPPPTNRTMRRILEHEPAGVEVPATEDKDDDEDEDELVGFQQNSLRVTAAEEVDFEACFDVPSTNSITIPVADANPALPASETIHIDDVLPEPILLRRLAETYDRERQLSFAHADNGSMACTANDRKLLFAYRPLSRTNVRLFDAGHHAHQPIGVGFLCVPVDNRGNAGGPSSVFIRTYYTPTIPGIIISHAAISKQLGTDGYHMSSFSENIGHIHFPHRLRRSQDIHIILQPTASRGGLTFTEALIAPTAEAHLAPLPSDQVVRKLCTEHAPVTAATILDPIDDLTFFGQGMAPAGLDFIVPVNIDTDRLSHEGHRSEDLLAQRPTILDGDVHFPELSSPLCTDAYAVRSLSRTALRMLWHQRLGHINFRRLSEMHRFVKGMPQFQIPTELEGCPICLAAKLRKAPKGIETTMRATTCNQGLSIDFGFMVQKSRDSVRHNTLVGLNGETCYVLLTDHFSGRIFGRAFATKAPPIDWINSWLASNSPQCPDKYVRMDGGGELGKCRDIHRTFANFGYAVELTGPDSSHQNGPGERPHQTIGDALRTMLSGANLQPNFWPYAFYHYIRLYNFVPPTAIDLQAHTRCVVPLSQIWQSYGPLDVGSTFVQRLLDTVASFRTPASVFFSGTRAP
ncbi:Retrotransposon gag protein [Fragilaria crotonensis]|nr:Retrotransposon gag protein [Fragilaria crotonensis]